MQGQAADGAAREWQRGWTLVFAAAMGFSFFSVMLATPGLFMESLGREFGWSRTLLSLGTTIATLITAVLSPFFGMLIDRYGARRVALPGLVLTTLSIAAFSLLSGSEMQWIVLWCVFGLCAVCIKSTVWTAAVLGVFDKSRGLALAFTLSGTALSQAVVPPLGNWLIEDFGWRWAYVWLGLGWGGVTLLVCVPFFVDGREKKARAAIAEPSSPEPTPAAPPRLSGLEPRQALADSALWRVGISNFLVLTLTVGLGIHLIPILTDAGVSRAHAAWLVSLAGIAGIAGKIITGILLDRFRPNWIGAIVLGASAFAFLLLVEGIRSPVLIVVAMIVNGYTAGTKTHITGYLTAAYGGMRHFGLIYGVMAAAMAVAGGVGPLLAGLCYDLTGGYGGFLLAGAAVSVFGGVLMATLPRVPDWRETGN